MHPIRFDALQKVLFVGAHSDDIEIGCGGTVQKLVAENPELEILWVVFSAEGVRRQEAERSAAAFLAGAQRAKVVVHDFRGSYFPHQGEEIKRCFETLKPFRPDLVFTHYRQDLHQDHRVLSELAWNTFRSHAILEYEIPKYDGDLGVPNVFVPLDEARCRRKATLVMEHFPSQAGKQWFSEDLFMALPRIRGMECDSPTRFAEAFYGRKLSLA
ncbi:MAG: PIG-L deacetylase family protein [Myxococcota bacterium]